MFKTKTKVLALSAAIAFGSSAAVAQQTDIGPFLPEVGQAIVAAEQGAQNICASNGGLASFNVIRIIQNAGYFAAQFEYSCNG